MDPFFGSSRGSGFVSGPNSRKTFISRAVGVHVLFGVHLRPKIMANYPKIERKGSKFWALRRSRSISCPLVWSPLSGLGWCPIPYLNNMRFYSIPHTRSGDQTNGQLKPRCSSLLGCSVDFASSLAAVSPLPGPPKVCKRTAQNQLKVA